jgi:predicted patatin/cPLA2 family phospholipase
MHPVIEHLIARKDKQVPVHDKRKIYLVLLGGLMTGVRGAGAVLALEELGLRNSFDRIYSLSAGFPNAAYFLTNNMRSGISLYYEDLCNKDFLNLARFWDVVDLEYAMHITRHIKPLDHKKISLSKTNVYVRLYDLENHKSQYKKVNGRKPEEIERMMRASISVPFLNPGSIEIDGRHYKDGGTMNYITEAINEVLESDATDVLVIYNHSDQYDRMKSAGLQDSKRLFQITPYREEDLSPVCSDPSVLKKAAEDMGTLVKNIFGIDSPLVL